MELITDVSKCQYCILGLSCDLKWSDYQEHKYGKCLLFSEEVDVTFLDYLKDYHIYKILSVSLFMSSLKYTVSDPINLSTYFVSKVRFHVFFTSS